MYTNLPLKALKGDPSSNKKPALGYSLLCGIKSFVSAVKLPALIGGAGFFLCFADCFSIPSPFAIVWLITLMALPGMMLPPLAGVLFATLMRLIWGMPFDIGLLAGCAVALPLRGKIQKGPLAVRILLTAAALSPRLILSFFSSQPTDILLCGISLLIGAASLPAFLLCVRALSDKRETFRAEEKVCTLMVLALILTGAGHIQLFTVNLGLLMALMLTLATGYVFGSASAVIAGLVCGASLALCGFSSNIMMQLCICGLCGGLMPKIEPRLIACGLFLLGGTLAALLTQADRFVWILEHLALCTALFLLIKKPSLVHFESWADQIKATRGERENTYAAEMLKKWEGAIIAITQALPIPTPPPDEADAAKVRQLLCSGCPHNELCWQLNEDALKAMFKDMWHRLQDGQADTDDVDALYGGECFMRQEVLDVLTSLKSDQAETHQRMLRAGYERDMIVTHLTAMAQAVRRLSIAAHGESLNDLKAAMEVDEALNALKFPGRLIYARRTDGHLRAAIEAEVIGFNRVSPDRITDMLYRLKKLEMEVTLETRTRIELEECPRYEIRTGHACLSHHAADDANGDAVLLHRLPGGKQLIMLSDGMGHGASASTESQKTLELLKLCLEAGYTRGQAITAVNGMMLSATGGDRFATVDLFLLDLWTGVCELSKLGACQSYFVRNGKIKPLSSAALPLGILERVTPENLRLRVNDEDILVLLSDGVADSFPDETALKQQLSRCLSVEPQKSADAFLRSALISAGGIPRDDMTVLIIRIIARPLMKAFSLPDSFPDEKDVKETAALYN